MNIAISFGVISLRSLSYIPRIRQLPNKSFDRFIQIDSDRSVLKRGFLDDQERSDFLRIVKDGREEHRVSRRANALLLLDDGMSYEQVAKVLYLDDSSVRTWRKSYEEAGVESTYAFDLKGSASLLSKLQTDELRVWATQVLPETTEVVGKFILDHFGLEYGKSGLIKLMHRIGFDWKKPETIPAKIDAETQREFIKAYEDLRNSLGPDETTPFRIATRRAQSLTRPASRAFSLA